MLVLLILLCRPLGFVSFIDEECALQALQHTHGIPTSDGTPLLLTIQVGLGGWEGGPASFNAVGAVMCQERVSHVRQPPPAINPWLLPSMSSIGHVSSVLLSLPHMNAHLPGAAGIS
jgi:hypothetical protein